MKRVGAALILVLVGVAMADDVLADGVSQSFGRLFTTPEEREMLDRIRQDKPSADASSVSVQPEGTNEASAIPAERSAKLSGVVLRGDGRHTVWVNGRSELSGEPASALVRPGKPSPNTLSVPVHGNNGTALLKPGQVWLMDERRVEESYQMNAGSSDEAPKTAGEDSGGQSQ